MNPISNAGVFLVSILFGIYILAVMLRLVLQLVRASFNNQLSQLIVKMTNPPLKPLRRFIPGFAGIDMASVVVMLLLQMAEIFLVFIIVYPAAPAIDGVAIYAVLKLIFLVFFVFFFSIFILALLSWFNPDPYNPLYQLLNQVADPVLRPARRFIRPISGFDFSVFFTIIGLWLMKILFLDPLSNWVGSLYPAIHLIYK